MVRQVENRYIPDYLTLPGEILEEYLHSYGMTQVEFARRLGVAKKTVNEIVNGKAPITPTTALKLERVFGRPAHFWSNLEQRYQEDKARLEDQRQLAKHLQWLDSFPINEMVKRGFIKKYEDKVSQLTELLQFFGIAFPEQWGAIYQQYQVDCRQAQGFTVDEEAFFAWLRQGEILAQKIDCAPFDKPQFRQALSAARKLTREKNPQLFLPELTRLCAPAGVAVVFLRELPKTHISGATRWLANKAIIQLSGRYKSNDQFWFTFFHEAGHILRHGRKDIFLEVQNAQGVAQDEAKEREADVFARDLLIPAAEYRRLCDRHIKLSTEDVNQFAAEIGIAPGIVTGRLQHDAVWRKNFGNETKVFYRWEDGKFVQAPTR